ncbi:MAG: phosphonate C-P lyase system protein PhnK, partial [Hyphomicrobiales bacterium]
MTGDQSAPLLVVDGLTKIYGDQLGCRDVSFELRPGEVLGIVGESGYGKTTVINCAAARLAPDEGSVSYAMHQGQMQNIHHLPEARRRLLMRTDWAFVHQNPRDGLRLNVSAGANVGERLMAIGKRHYGNIRNTAIEWLDKVEVDTSRIDDVPSTFSGGMQQRLQIARNLVTGPRIVFMDEPTGGLDVSVQARLLDLLPGLVQDLQLAVVMVTHDLAVARAMG